MNEQTRYRVTGSLFLLAVAVITLPMLFDGDGVPGVDLDPIDSDFTPPKVAKLDDVAPASDFKERVVELREQVDDDGFHRDTQTAHIRRHISCSTRSVLPEPVTNDVHHG